MLLVVMYTYHHITVACSSDRVGDYLNYNINILFWLRETLFDVGCLIYVYMYNCTHLHTHATASTGRGFHLLTI